MTRQFKRERARQVAKLIYNRDAIMVKQMPFFRLCYLIWRLRRLGGPIPLLM